MIAGVNHARILIAYGIGYDYGGMAWPSALYWSSLTLIDPFAALLLFVCPKWGIIVVNLLIVSNVLHNLFVTWPFLARGEWAMLPHVNPMIVAQIIFLIFVATTTRIAWCGVRSVEA